MLTITLQEVEAFLDSRGISHFLEGHIGGERPLAFASIFEAIKGGFYFYLEARMTFPVTDSLLLASVERPMKDQGDGNAVLYIDAHPQVTYYRLMQELCSSESTGYVSPHSLVDPSAELGPNVQIDPFCVVGRVRIGANAIIGSHCVLHDNTNLEEHVRIESGSVIGASGVAWAWNEDETRRVVQPQIGGVHIGAHSFLGAQTVIVRGSINEDTQIGRNTMLAPGARLGHGTRIGDFVHLANNVITGGNTRIADYCFVGSSAVFRPKVRIHPGTIVGAGAVVTKDTTKPGTTLVGVPASEKCTKSHPSGVPQPRSDNR